MRALLLCLLCSCAARPPALLHWQADGRIRRACDQGSIALRVAPEVPIRLIRALTKATMIWNGTLGYRLFAIENNKGVRVDVVVDNLDTPTWNAAVVYSSRHRGLYRECADRITLVVAPKTFVYTDYQLYLIMSHELGHILGLSDNDYRGSVMFRHVHYTEGAAVGAPPVLENPERKWVTQQYGRPHL